MKQLGSTPHKAFCFPVTTDRSDISCAVAGDIANAKYAIHVVNNGAERQLTVHNISSSVKQFNIYITDGDRGMKKINTVSVANNKATFTLESQAYTTLLND